MEPSMRYLSPALSSLLVLVLVLVSACCCPQPAQDGYCCGPPPASAEVYVPGAPAPGVAQVVPLAPGERDIELAAGESAPQVFIECTCVLAGEHFLKDAGDGSDRQYLDATAAEALLRAIQKSEHMQVVQAPKLLAVDGQQASIFIGETIGTDQPLTGAAKSPFLRAHATGFHMTATPRVLDSGRIQIDAHLFLREPGTEEAPLAGPVYETALQMDLGPGEALLVRTAGEPAGSKHLVTIVTAHVLKSGAE
jgi:hypothetical protein